MAYLLTSLPRTVLPATLDRVEWARETDAETAVRVTLSAGGTVLLDDVALFFDLQGRAALEDLAPLLADCRRAEDETPGVMGLELTYSRADGAAVVEDDLVLMPCRAALLDDAATLARRRFLTLCAGPKHTTPDDTERLWLYAPEGEALPAAATVTLTALTPDGRQMADAGPVVLPLTRPAADDYACVTVRVADLVAAADGAELTGFVVEAGDRRAEFLLTAAPYGSEAVAFVNAFGCRETLRLWQTERTAKPTREAALTAGRYRLYSVEDATTWKGTTGPLTDGELPMADDAVHALSLEREADGVRLALTDSEWTRSSGPDATPRLSLTWRETGRRPVVRLLPAGAAGLGVFDATFDSTFE